MSLLEREGQVLLLACYWLLPDPIRRPGIRAANLSLLAVGAFNAGQVLLVTLYLQEGRHLLAVLTGLCFLPQAAGAFALRARPRTSSPAWATPIPVVTSASLRVGHCGQLTMASSVSRSFTRAR